MIRKTLIILAAAATLATGMAATAQAKPKFDIDINIGGGHHGIGFYPDYGDYYDDDCYVKVKKVKVWSHIKHKYVWRKKEVLVCY